ncbi:PAS domain-containing protein [Sphingomonas sp.]|jgi:PAS domain S-box-containing protein|uniref:PAS domain-containing protein n=1 Tax=Sphingomonas sp. TaxID=28214 RepID=UPI003567D568
MAPNDLKTGSAHAMAGLRFLDGGGAVGALLRGFDWASHPLGPPQDWHAALKLSVGLCLRSSFPTAIYWGPDFRLLYNDAWTVLADNHPWALGRPAAEARPDIWPVLGAQFRETLAAGEGISHVAQRLMMLRGGVPTETFWSYNSSPILDEEGVAHGILNQGLEVTAQVLNERALIAAKSERDFVLDLVEQQRAQHDADDVMQLTAEAVGRYLSVDRAGFFEVTPDHIVEYGACWAGGALPPLTRPIPAAIFGSRWGDAVRAGETITFNAPDDRDAPPVDALNLVGSRAGVTVPLLRGGEWQGGFYLSHSQPRVWARGEIALIEEVAELSWDAVARVRAVERLRAMNADLAGEVAARTAERDLLWEVSEDLLGIATRDGRWLSVNPAWERALGWSAAHILGRDSQWLRHPEDAGGSAAEIARIAAIGTTHRMEKRLRTQAGDYRTFAWQTTLFGDRLYTNARDITEERRQQSELLAAETRTRMVLQAMDGVGVWTYDLAHDRFESDSDFAALYGFTPEHVARGVTLADVLARIHPEDLPHMQAAIAHVRATGGDGANEYRLQLPDGSVRWIMARNHVLRDPDGKPGKVVGVGVDVSRQRELEERLRQSQKMEAVGQLTGGLAHDFNNLLTGISGALELMQLRLNQGRIDDLPRYIGAAQSGAARAAALTHRLLAFSRRQPLDPRPIDVPKLIAGMEDLVHGTLGPSIALNVATGADSWPILADANQLENALLNLCINARDAMPDGGTVTITTHNVVLDQNAASERDVPPGAYLSLSVADTGTGMTPEVIARAFDPFFTTKPMGQGTGLGLSMIYGFVRQSGGHVQIDSACDRGTTMTLLLPRHTGKAADLSTDGVGPAIPVGAGETVLVVEDEPTVRMLILELLDELGYTAIETETGNEALKVLESPVRIDLLITDVGLPGGMNGRQVADAARASRPELPVLFITGFAENAVVGDGPLEPGMALIAKPFAMDTLAARIRAMLAGA